MESLPPPPAHSTPRRASTGAGSSSSYGKTRSVGWEIVEAKNQQNVPCQRSLHAGAVWRDNFVVFGGYDGLHRVNDLHCFNFTTQTWHQLSNINAPSPRDRHVAVVHENSLYIFGGFDGLTRVNDLYAYDLEKDQWRLVVAQAGVAPTPRHSHSAVVYQDSMYVLGGYDGSYRSDFHAFHFPTGVWRQVLGHGDLPRARYRGTCVVCISEMGQGTMILHGGHDGTRHLQDTHIFDFATQTWAALATEGPSPSPRDSHVAVVHGRSMYLYGGSTGSAMGDFHELRLEFRRVWRPVTLPEGEGPEGASSTPFTLSPTTSAAAAATSLSAAAVVSPGARFCHVGVVYGHNFYLFGGYDGSRRLNDFLCLRLDMLHQHHHLLSSSPYPSSSCSALWEDAASMGAPGGLLQDLRSYVNASLLSDVVFLVEERPVYAHKILLLRCPYFRHMLTGEYMESTSERPIVISDVSYDTFVLLLEFLYTDQVEITTETAMELFQAADHFAVDRLKLRCEREMLRAIDVDSAAHVLFTADQYNAQNLREHCLDYILRHFDAVSRTPAFEEMGRINVELIFEILRRR